MLIRIFTLIFVFTLTSAFTGSWSSNKPDLWDYWVKHDVSNTKDVDHKMWDGFLQKYITTDETGLNRFAYSSVSREDKRVLKSYIKSLEDVKITARSRPVQYAYWLNLYNALTIDVILDHYPVKSIRDIDISGLFSNGPWGKKLLEIEGQEVSLNDIEHQILRPIWRDPRIHYGVNCASIGCPNLQKIAFTAQNVDELLERGARDFINHPRGLTIKGSDVTVSKIYQWFAYDFGNSEENIIKHIAKYLPVERAAQLKKIGALADAEYDWKLNE